MLYRKIPFFVFVVFQLFGAETPAHAQDLVEFPVELAQVFLQPDGMYFVAENSLPIEVASVEFKNGAYIVTAPKKSLEELLGLWPCPDCRRYNSNFELTCAHCGNPKS